jgi:hypothetical protein
MSTLWATQSLQPDRFFRLDAISDPPQTPRHPDCPTSVRDVGMLHPPWRFLRPLVASNFTEHTNFVCIGYNLTYMILFEKPLCDSVPECHSQFVRHRQMFELLGFLTGGVVGLAFLGARIAPFPYLWVSYYLPAQFNTHLYNQLSS